MADVTLTITLPDIEAHALVIVAASLGPKQFEQAYEHWLNHWRAIEAYSPQVEVNMMDLMGEAANRFTRRPLEIPTPAVAESKTEGKANTPVLVALSSRSSV